MDDIWLNNMQVTEHQREEIGIFTNFLSPSQSYVINVHV
jgi:hypothetical protein